METEICRKCEEEKPINEFYKNRHNGLHSWCKKCEEPTHKISNRRQALRIRHNITIEQYDEMFKRQNGVCAICNKPETSRNQYGVKRLAIDHNHKTGKIRGLLCYQCNAKLATLEDKDFVKKAEKYLRDHPQ